MPPTLDTMADLTLEQRNAALAAWLNDLTTVYEKCAAERGAFRAALAKIANSPSGAGVIMRDIARAALAEAIK